MKSLKFSDGGQELILRGLKTSTWRVNDDKNFSIGDRFELISSQTFQRFATGIVESITVKKLAEISEAEYLADGWGYADKLGALEVLRKYYGDEISENTLINIIDFKLVQ